MKWLIIGTVKRVGMAHKITSPKNQPYIFPDDKRTVMVSYQYLLYVSFIFTESKSVNFHVIAS